ncbi:PEP-CTERM sorting domain-containing protein [Tautonia sp. JC769]|uniref:PEP-CTERM sorting domain-containing protein n=1 Tax=Tautonia sp. JC769 TaxID=3232135 RepID=UPI00345A8A02
MTRQPFPLIIGALLGVLSSGVAPQTAEAGFILREVKAEEVLDPIGFYQAELVLTGLPGTFINGSNDPNERDFVTVFDIPDLEGDVGKPAGWSSRADLIPDGLPVGFDDPTLPNLTFSYLAGEPIFLPSGVSELVIGAFSWQTFDVNPLILLREIRYAWQTSRRLDDGTVIKETGFNVAPVFVIPEPASVVMTAAGLGLVGLLVRLRRRSPIGAGGSAPALN